MMLGNMTRAAEFLGVSQPAVSRLMAELQRSAGFTLFTRTRYGMVPTADAEALFDEVKSMFSGLEELTRRTQAIRNLEQGELKIGTISLYGNGLLPMLIAEFVERHPNLKFTIETDSHNRIVDRIHARRCEIGFVSLPAADADLTVQLLAARPALCAMPADHPLAAKALIQPADLADLPFISFPRDTSTRFQVDSMFDRLGISREMRVEAGTHESVVNFVARGVGLSIISPFSPHLKSDSAVAFRPFHPPLMREIGMLSNEDFLSSAARTFRDFVTERFADPSFGYGQDDTIRKITAAGGKGR